MHALSDAVPHPTRAEVPHRQSPLGPVELQVRQVRRGVQQAVQAGEARAEPWARQTVRVRAVRQQLLPAGEPEAPREDARGEEDVQVQRLHQDVHGDGEAGAARADPQEERVAVPVRGGKLWGGVPRQG